MSISNLSIRSKMMLMIITTSALSVFMCCGAYLYYGLERAEAELASNIGTQADVVASNVAGMLDFNDAGSAEEIIEGLSSNPDIIQAAVFTADGALFASFTREGNVFSHTSFEAVSDGDVFTEHYFETTTGSYQDDQRLGTVVVRTDLEALEKLKDELIIISIVVLAATLFIAILISLGFQRLITGPMHRLVTMTEEMNDEFTVFVKSVNKIAENDLTVRIPVREVAAIDINSNDEMGRLAKAVDQTNGARVDVAHALNGMTSNFNAVIRRLSVNAEKLIGSSTEISSSSEQMSRGAQDQADEISQVSTAMEEMTATILETSKLAGEATDASQNASDTADSGGQIVSDTIHGMQKIAGVVRESAESIAKLASSADQIGEIIRVIDDIADQTNLLALNAAIEAARAGEQGRGFAVVADEVRKLAERTGKATGEITGMIKGIQTETEDAVHSMEAGVQEVDKGRALADKAGNSLSEIANMSQRVKDLIRHMATGSEEQSIAAEQISKNMVSVAAFSKETATNAEQSNTVAELLNEQADGLRKLVAEFKCDMSD